jgi:hypothetical protein
MDVQLQRVRLNGICTIDFIKSLVVAVFKNSEDNIHPKINNALRNIRIRIYKLTWMFVQGIWTTTSGIIVLLGLVTS